MVNGLWVNTTDGVARVIVPNREREMLVRKVHENGHPGIKGTTRALKSQYVWKGMTKDIKEFVENCEKCKLGKPYFQRGKVQGAYPFAEKFRHVHMDIVGPLPMAWQGHLYILTIMDRFSRYLVAVPLKGIRAETVVEAFYENWITRFGVPQVVVTDQGTQFESEVMAELCKRWGVDKRRTCAYHPQANGLVERSHQEIKKMMRCMLDNKRDWGKWLQTIVFAYNTSVKEDGWTPAKVAFAADILVPADLIVPRQELVNGMPRAEYIRELDRIQEQLRRQFYYDLEREEEERHIPRAVYLRVPVKSTALDAPYEGPFPVLRSRFPNLTIRYKGKERVVNWEQVKSADRVDFQEEERAWNLERMNPQVRLNRMEGFGLRSVYR